MSETEASNGDDGERESPSPGRIKRFYSDNPLVGFAGSIASVAGVIVAIVLFQVGVKERELVYQVGERATIYRHTGDVTGLQLLYDDKQIDEHVYTSTVAFWNAGDQFISAEDILESVKVSIAPPARILAVGISKVSRDLTGLAIADVSRTDHSVEMSWRILEEGDGAALLLVHTDPDDVGVQFSAVIKGQGHPRIIASNLSSRSRTEHFIGKLIGWAMIGVASFMIISACFKVAAAPSGTRMKAADEWSGCFLGGPLTLAVGMWIITSVPPPSWIP